jgi:hypothetical protein
MKLITDETKAKLLENGVRMEIDEGFDPEPVVKFFTPDGSATWLISAMYPDAPDLLFGLCDLGLGHPELGDVSLSELLALRGRMGLPVERDLHFRARATLSEYADEASSGRRIKP